MSETLFEISAVVLGLTEMLKQFIPEKDRTRFAPHLAVIIAVVTNIYQVGYSPDAVMTGIMIGLTVTGLYRGGKKFAKISS